MEASTSQSTLQRLADLPHTSSELLATLLLQLERELQHDAAHLLDGAGIEVCQTPPLAAETSAEAQGRRQDTVYADAFPFVEVLSPLSSHPDADISARANECLQLVATHASAKEVVVAICERLAHLGAENREDEGDAPRAVEEFGTLVKLYGTSASSPSCYESLGGD